MPVRVGVRAAKGLIYFPLVRWHVEELEQEDPVGLLTPNLIRKGGLGYVLFTEGELVVLFVDSVSVKRIVSVLILV